MKVILCSNTAWSLFNFRAAWIRALIAAGHVVVAVAPPDRHVTALEATGCRFVPLPMDNKGTHPLRDGWLFLRFFRLLRQERPGLLITFTIKPCIYGGLAARVAGCPHLAVITGLGTAFNRGGWLEAIVRTLYRHGLARAREVWFMNRDDQALFLAQRIVSTQRAGLIPGSGVDLERFSVMPQPADGPMRFCLIARMLRDKGVEEFITAVRLLRDEGYALDAVLVGPTDVDNLTALSREDLLRWDREGVIRYLGEKDDVRPVLAEAHCVVLPSYREGTPRALLEGAAMGRVLITTDAPGCRDTVEDGVTGFLCAPRSATSLAEAMRKVLHLPHDERVAMGLRGRARMEALFDQRLVVRRVLAFVSALERQPA